jgi:uncharacterized membrane protein
VTTKGKRVGTPDLTASAPAKSWWRRPWIIPLGLLVLTFLYLSLPKYLTLDPMQSLIPVNPGFGPHYALMLAHIFTGTVAIVTAVLQVWPRLRDRKPAVHRVSGRLYVWAGMVPTAILSLAITPFGYLDGFGALGSSIWAVIALFTTLMGWSAAREGRFGDHRKLMVYSFAMVTSILTGRLFFYTTWYGLAYIPSLTEHLPAISQISGFWFNWIINLGVAYWWLNRGKRKVAAVPATTATAATTISEPVAIADDPEPTAKVA